MINHDGELLAPAPVPAPLAGWMRTSGRAERGGLPHRPGGPQVDAPRRGRRLGRSGAPRGEAAAATGVCEVLAQGHARASNKRTAGRGGSLKRLCLDAAPGLLLPPTSSRRPPTNETPASPLKRPPDARHSRAGSAARRRCRPRDRWSPHRCPPNRTCDLSPHPALHESLGVIVWFMRAPAGRIRAAAVLEGSRLLHAGRSVRLSSTGWGCPLPGAGSA